MFNNLLTPPLIDRCNVATNASTNDGKPSFFFPFFTTFQFIYLASMITSTTTATTTTTSLSMTVVVDDEVRGSQRTGICVSKVFFLLNHCSQLEPQHAVTHTDIGMNGNLRCDTSQVPPVCFITF